MMLISLGIYLAAAYGLTLPSLGLGNHGLWLALLLFFLVRTITLSARFPALLREAFD
jgi:multidrug resistance protein, MATE family